MTYVLNSGWRWPLLFLWLLVWASPLSHWLRATMTGHMLLQMPVLVLGGMVMADALWHRLTPFWRRMAHQHRWTLLLLSLATLAIWMIPRLLDLAVEEARTETLKVLSLTILAGMGLRLSWQLHGPVVRGLVHVELLATFGRLGWIYLISPNRLCIQYGMDDQTRLGHWLLICGALYGLRLLWTPLLGSPPPLESVNHRVHTHR